MIEVESFFMIDNKFYNVFEFSGNVPDRFYIEGAIVLNINGTEMITKEMWDLVDQLWAYITFGLTQVLNDGNFSTYFPDQPIPIEFIPKGTHVLVRIGASEGVNKAFIGKKEFVSTLAEHAKEFFAKLNGSSDPFVKTLDQILQQAKHLPVGYSGRH